MTAGFVPGRPPQRSLASFKTERPFGGTPFNVLPEELQFNIASSRSIFLLVPRIGRLLYWRQTSPFVSQPRPNALTPAARLSIPTVSAPTVFTTALRCPSSCWAARVGQCLRPRTCPRIKWVSSLVHLLLFRLGVLCLAAQDQKNVRPFKKKTHNWCLQQVI